MLPLVIEVADAITNGFAPNFTRNIEIEEILDGLVKNLCTGSDARFQGILILFDELNYYLDSWLTDRHLAGNTAPQNLTNACANHKAKIALMSFTQVNPNSKSTRDGFQQISTRLAPADATYSPVSSLEKVIDDVILQESEKWQTFRKKWDNTLWATSERTYKLARKYQDGQNLNQKEFHDHLGLGCFPLHPLAGYLLCNLEFTQGRTAIEFVKKEVGEFLAQPTEVQQPNRPNYLHAISLVDAFAPNFQSSKNKAEVYRTYLNVLDAIRSEADLDEISVVKAIFLYTVSGELILKAPHEPHEKILVDLSGLPEFRLREALDRLQNERQAVYRRPDGIYQFFKNNPIDLIKRVIAELEEQLRQRPNSPSKENIFVEYCRDNMTCILGEEVTKANLFATENGLIASDWYFQNQILTIEEFEKFLQKPQAITNAINKGCQGIVVYVVDSNVRDLEGVTEEIDALLSQSPLKERLVIAVAKQDIGEDEDNLGRVLQKITVLKTVFRSEIGTPTYNKVLSDWEKQVRDGASGILKIQNLTIASIRSSKVRNQDHFKISSNVSALLKELYPFVPSVGNSSNIKLDNTASKQIVTALATWMLGKGKIEVVDLPKHNKAAYQGAIDMFEKTWGVFEKRGNEYYVKKPTNNNILAAWEMIDQLCDLKDKKIVEITIKNIREKLFNVPYGYHDLTFTVLMFAWISFHRSEVSLKGTTAIQSSTRSAAPRVEERELNFWATTNIVEKLDNLIKEWIVKLDAKLIRRQMVAIPDAPTLPIDYEKAIIYLQESGKFLENNSSSIEATSVREWQTKIKKFVRDFDAWIQPVQTAVKLNRETSLESLLQLYPQILKEYSIVEIKLSPSQQALQHQALQRLQSLIEERVGSLQVDTDNLATIPECASSISKIEAAINSLQLVTALPDRHIQDLEKSKHRIAQRQKEIQTREQITQKLREVLSRYAGLSQNATQKELMDAQTDIIQFAQVLPSLTNEAKYQETLQNISDRQTELKQQLQSWGGRYLNPDTSKSEAIDLRDEIAKQESRYTENADRQRLHEISNYLKQLIQGKADIENVAATNAESIKQAEQSIKAIITDSKTISLMIENYKQLQSLKIISSSEINVDDLQTQLKKLKSDGYNTLIDKFIQSINRCDTPINKREEYTQRNGILQQIRTLLPVSPEFEDIRVQIAFVSTSLEKRLEEFNQKQQDRNIVEQIKRLPLSGSDTIKQCEKHLKDIQNLRQKLNNPNVYLADIEQRIADFNTQIDKQQGELIILQNRLVVIVDPKELDRFKTDYAKLDLVFKDSFHYDNYQLLQNQIDALDEDLDVIRDLEKLKQKSNSIVECQQSRQQLAEASQKIADRFQSQVKEIDKYLSDRVNQYRLDLENFDQRLVTITGLKTAQKSQTELAQKSVYYLNSEPDELLYNQIRDRLSRLQTLFQLVDSTEPQTINEYEQRLQKMQQWLEEDSQLPEWLNDRYREKRRETEKNRQTLLDKKRKEAREWVKSVDLELQAALSDSDRDRQANKATELIKLIRNEKAEYFDGLVNELEEQLDAIAQECQNILELDLESQIITRFRQLPQARRANLYAKLEAFLTDKTEEY